MQPTDEPTKLPTMSTERWLEHVRKLEETLRDASSDRDRYRTLLYGTWTLIGVVLTLVGIALVERRHAGIGAYCVVAVGVIIAWRSIYISQRRSLHISRTRVHLSCNDPRRIFQRTFTSSSEPAHGVSCPVRPESRETGFREWRTTRFFSLLKGHFDVDGPIFLRRDGPLSAEER
jgi:hypothetical protein